MKDPFSGIESNFPPLTKKTLLGLYAASAFFTVAGLIGIYNQASDIPIDTSHLLVAVAITLFGDSFRTVCLFQTHDSIKGKDLFGLFDFHRWGDMDGYRASW